jgi:hypothetical protein
VDAVSRFTVATGDPHVIRADSLEGSAVDTITSSLKNFAEIVRPAPSPIDQLPPAKRRRFYIEHSMVNIAQPNPDLIELHLMKRKDGGFMGDTKRQISLRSSGFKAELIKAVLDLTGSDE